MLVTSPTRTVPLCRKASMPRPMPASTSAGDSAPYAARVASSQSSQRAWGGTCPARAENSRWTWQFTTPGRMAPSPWSQIRPVKPDKTSAAGPTAAIRSPATTTAPSRMGGSTHRQDPFTYVRDHYQ